MQLGFAMLEAGLMIPGITSHGCIPTSKRKSGTRSVQSRSGAGFSLESQSYYKPTGTANFTQCLSAISIHLPKSVRSVA